MSKPSNGLRAALEQVALEIARDVGHHGCARRIHAALEANLAPVGAPEPECGHRLFDPGCSVCARTYFNWARDRIADLECAVDENTRLAALVERFDGWLTQAPHRKGCKANNDSAAGRYTKDETQCSCGRNALLLAVMDLHEERSASDNRTNGKPAEARR